MGGREKGGKGERGDDGLSDGDNSGEDETSKRRSLIFCTSKSNNGRAIQPWEFSPFDTRDVTSSTTSYTASPVPSRP